MMVRLSTTLWLIVTLRLTSSFHRGRQRYRGRVRRRSAISILQRSKSMVASAGSVALATTGQASLRLQSPDSVRSAGRSKDWMQRAEPDDKLWYASPHDSPHFSDRPENVCEE